MDSSQYIEALLAEKTSLDPSYHVHAIRLITEGKKTQHFFLAKLTIVTICGTCVVCCENICFVLVANRSLLCALYCMDMLVYGDLTFARVYVNIVPINTRNRMGYNMESAFFQFYIEHNINNCFSS